MHDPVPQFGPPTYDWLRQWEKNLPQHDLELPAPEGKNGRYVKFTNQIKMLGWNNCLAEMLMNAHLAYASGRAYVFQDYFWEPSHYPWPKEQQLEYPPRTPLTALISGPTAGGPWESGDEAPRSISSDWFDVVCPPENRRIINTREVKPQVKDAPGSEVFEAWRKVLAEAPEGCVEIQPAEEDFFSQTFDMFLWITPRIVSLWDNFSNSPTSRLLDASPIVRSAVERNEYLFMPRGNSAGPYERMLAMHLRRGDYDEHCKRLARENQTFYGWNHLTFLPDPFIPPPGNAEDPENVAIYMRRCYPTFAEVVQKVHDARSEYLEERKKRQLHTPKTLDILYLLTNEKGSWLEDLMDALHEDGWDTIRTSKDLILDQEQTDVGMAADMEIARRAAVFIGNGWSSMSSNIVHKRLVDEKIPKSNRFL
ncbi:hypothetical protein K435DRAFT_660580 [Dendrothele bispora CBS 962.96]|uniref:Uncharacterized protein n=1 Tax=Dendrothele bispora (strain CBS 962.96) TaxID=1314807 RepID=A0A4S8M8F3_DENBC|nr:hypothetical protein K435DRAFT_660580 [Dendrothele bispora CBS 962.96]